MANFNDTQQTPLNLDQNIINSPNSIQQYERNNQPNQDSTMANLFVKNYQTLKILHDNHLEQFSHLQSSAFNYIYWKKDLIIKSGESNSLSFVLPITERIRQTQKFDSKSIQAIILCSSSEYAENINRQLNMLKNYPNEYKVAVLYEGAHLQEQLKLAILGVDYLVSTTKILVSLFQKGVIKINNLNSFCIYKGDELVKQGLNMEMDRMLQYLQRIMVRKTQIIIFTKILTSQLEIISQKYMEKNYILLDLIQPLKSKNQVQNFSVFCFNNSKFQHLLNTISAYCKGLFIIFSKIRSQTQIINQNFLKAGFQIPIIYPELTMQNKQLLIDNLKMAKMRGLIISEDYRIIKEYYIPEIETMIFMQPQIDDYHVLISRIITPNKLSTSIIFYNQTQEEILLNMEKKFQIKCKKISPPKLIDLIQTSSRGMIQNLKKVPVSANYMQLARKFISLENGNIVNALSKALAFMSGVTKKIPSKSLLSGLDGFITYTIKSKNKEDSLKQIYNFLNRNGSSTLISNIVNLTKFENNIYVFDLPEQFQSDMEKCILQFNNPFIIQRTVNLSQYQLLDQQKPSNSNLSIQKSQLVQVVFNDWFLIKTQVQLKQYLAYRGIDIPLNQIQLSQQRKKLIVRVNEELVNKVKDTLQAWISSNIIRN